MVGRHTFEGLLLALSFPSRSSWTPTFPDLKGPLGLNEGCQKDKGLEEKPYRLPGPKEEGGASGQEDTKAQVTQH